MLTATSNTAPALVAGPCELCFKCGNAPARICNDCQFSAFCSEDCKQISEEHDRLCKSLEKRLSKAPSADHIRGVILLENEEATQFCWLKVVSKIGFVPDLGNTVDTRPILGQAMSTYRRFVVSKSMPFEKELGHNIIVIHKNFTDSKPSKVIRNMLGCPAKEELTGTLLLVCSDSSHTNFRHVSFSDIKHVVHWLQHYGYENHKIYHKQPTLGYHLNMAQGVRIACEGDEKHLKQAKFSSVMVPHNHPIFHHPDGEPPIGDNLGIPLAASQLVHDPYWAEDFKSSENQSATFLHIITNPKDEMFPYAPVPEWQNDVGSIIVVHKDKKALHPRQVKALCDFCQFELLDNKFTPYEEADRVEECEDEILGLMKPDFFRAWWSGYREGKVRGGDMEWEQEKCLVDEDADKIVEAS